jgi:hyperosmotically inducible periplasmic protein
MLKNILTRFSGTAVLIFMISLVQVGMASTPKGTAVSAERRQINNLQDRVRHTLLMLPNFGVFDDLNFALQRDTVTLTGEVRTAILKSEAEAAVRKTEGVEKVINNIDILPLSPMDDSLCVKTYRAVYSMPGFERYAIQAVQPIRVIVKNGNITLDGVVATQLDRILAETAARILQRWPAAERGHLPLSAAPYTLPQ